MKAFQRVLGRRIVDWQLDVLRPLFSHIVMVSNDPQLGFTIGLPIIVDRTPGLGPLAGIDAALSTLDTFDEVVCVACDMPFLSPRLVQLIRDHQPGRDAAVPLTSRGAEPMLARWNRRAAATVQAQLACNDTSVASALVRLDVAYIPEPMLRTLDPDLRSFANLSTRADPRRAVARAEAAYVDSPLSTSAAR